MSCTTDGIKVDVQNNIGNTALILACKTRNADAVHLLLEAGEESKGKHFDINVLNFLQTLSILVSHDSCSFLIFTIITHSL